MFKLLRGIEYALAELSEYMNGLYKIISVLISDIIALYVHNN